MSEPHEIPEATDEDLNPYHMGPDPVRSGQRVSPALEDRADRVLQATPPHGHRRVPCAHGGRRRADVHRASCAAQSRPRARKRRRPVPPRGHRGRGARAGFMDDLEVRGGGCPLRRGQGRRCLQPEGVERSGPSAYHTAVHLGTWATASGPQTDIPAPDVNTSAQTMAWVYDTYRGTPPWNKQSTGGHGQTPGSRRLAGPRGGNGPRASSTPPRAPSTAGSSQAAVRSPALTSSSRVGATSAPTWSISFWEEGARIIAVSDSQGGILNKEGLDLEAVREHRRDVGSVVGLAGTTTITNEQLLEVPVRHPRTCGALADKSVGTTHPGSPRRLVVEAANGPTTPEADQILAERGIHVLPDILANAGGVVVSYFEWVQNTGDTSNGIWRRCNISCTYA